MAARTKKLIVVAALLAATGGLKASGYLDGISAATGGLSPELTCVGDRRAGLNGPPREPERVRATRHKPAPGLKASGYLHGVVAGRLQPSATRAVAGSLQASGEQRRPARRIVSLVPALTEMLFAVGAGPQVVAVSSYDDFPPEVKSLPSVGALLDPDVERILSLRPDLVITYGSQAELDAQLARAGIRTFSYRHGGIATVLQTLRDLGAATGRSADAERTALEIEARLDVVRARVRGRARPRTLLVFDRQPTTLQQLYAAGGRGFLHEMLEVAGGANVFADVPRESVQPSHETLLVRAPEVVLEVRATGLLAPADPAREGAVWSALASIPAVRNRRIHFLNGDYFVVPGPRLAQATEAFARALHPEAFR